MLILHDPACADYGTEGHPEQPARVRATAAHLHRCRPGWAWRIPTVPTPDDVLLLAHTPAHLRRLAEPCDFDGDTPFYPGIGDHARRGVAAALEAVDFALRQPQPAPVFSLMRPPGHHATAGQAMGFCYLNQAAVATLAAQRRMGAARVAVWDFDAHHGNGTEAILLRQKDILYSSVHQFPGYPGTGARDVGNSRNWPVPPGTPRPAHLAALQASWEAVLAFRPDLVVVSAGFDAYARDPITEMTLETEDFAALGRWLRESGLRAAAVLEGGYSPDLPLLVEAFLAAWEAE